MTYTYETRRSGTTETTLTCTREDGASTTMTLTVFTDGTGTYTQSGDFLLLPLGAYGLPLPTDDPIENAGYYTIILDRNTEPIPLADTVTIGDTEASYFFSNLITFSRDDGETTKTWSLESSEIWSATHYSKSGVSAPINFGYYPYAWLCAVGTDKLPLSKGIRVKSGSNESLDDSFDDGSTVYNGWGNNSGWTLEVINDGYSFAKAADAVSMLIKTDDGYHLVYPKTSTAQIRTESGDDLQTVIDALNTSDSTLENTLTSQQTAIDTLNTSVSSLQTAEHIVLSDTEPTGQSTGDLWLEISS